MARPRKPIDWNVIEELCAQQCTQEEIAAELDISVDTLERACRRDKRASFAEFFEQKRMRGFVSLRRRQFLVANGGNPTMLIWLGKQHLGQTDKVETTKRSPHLEKLFASLED
jgi:hypothetical protein